MKGSEFTHSYGLVELAGRVVLTMQTVQQAVKHDNGLGQRFRSKLGASEGISEQRAKLVADTIRTPTGPYVAAPGRRSCCLATKGYPSRGLPGGESEASLASALFNVQHVYNNPVKYQDPTGHDPWWCETETGAQDCTSDYYENGGGGVGEQIEQTEEFTLAQKLRLYDRALELVFNLYDFPNEALYEGLEVIYDPDLPEGVLGRSITFDEETGEWQLGPIRIGEEAFSSLGVLLSTLDHEGVHIKQFNTGAWDDNLASDPNNYGFLLMEYEAYKWEETQYLADNPYGLTDAEFKDLETNISDFGPLLPSELLINAANGDYRLPEEWR